MTYVAQINRKGTCVPYCSGTILSETFVLTAAHCLHNERGWFGAGDLTIAIGAKRHNGCDGVKHKVLRHFYPREVYRVGEGTGDIGLIQVILTLFS